MAKTKELLKQQAEAVIDERYSLQTFDGLLKTTEDLFNRYLVPCANPIELEEVKGAAILLREARGILDSRRRANAAKVLDVEDDRTDFKINAAGPFNVFQGGGR